MLTLLKKIYRKFFDKKQTIDKYLKQKNIAESTIIRNPNPIRFDVEPEKRIYVKIGEKCFLSANFIFESQKGYIEIGNNVQMNGVMLISREKIIIEDNVTMAWNITIYDHNSHSIYWKHRQQDNEQTYNDFVSIKNTVINKNWENVKSAPIHIKSKAWIGMNVLILKGVTIGEGAVIGAGSVVTKDIPAWTVAAGNPAKVVKNIPENLR